MTTFFEMIMAIVIMFTATAAAGMIGMPLLNKLQVGQTVRDDGPKSHYKKSGTLTFGGFFFLIPLMLAAIIVILFWPELQSFSILVLIMLFFAFAGFMDDYIKVRISKKGLSVIQKTLLLGLFSVLFTVYYLYLAPSEPFLLLPLSSNPIMITGWFKLPYGLLVVLYLFFVCNSVNLTDGVDGLASSVTVVSSIFIAAAAWLLRTLAPDSRAVWLFSLAVAGGCLGFLIFNRHPARVFMGDTGSQALGAGLAAACLILGVPWLIAIAGVIYMAESFSVMIQVAYFKKTGGKRIFRMSPIHHHYELGGWKEVKIVIVFTLITVIGGVAALLLILPAWQL